MAENGKPRGGNKVIITPEAMLCWPRLFTPEKRKETDANAFYSCALVFGPDADLGKLKAACAEAAREKWGEKAKEMYAEGKLKFPFRDDVKDRGYAPGSILINIKSKRKPDVVSVYAGPNGKPAPITDEDAVYPGCFVKASVRAYVYDEPGNRGVSFALGNIQKVRDGERLGGFTKAEDEFEATEKAADAFEQQETTQAAPAAAAPTPHDDPFA